MEQVARVASGVSMRLWRERFADHTDQVAKLDSDEAFCRMWTPYPAYFLAGFRSGYLDVRQTQFTRKEQA